MKIIGMPMGIPLIFFARPYITINPVIRQGIVKTGDGTQPPLAGRCYKYRYFSIRFEKRSLTMS